MRDALLEIVPDAPVHAVLRGLVLDPSAHVVGDERGALVFDDARGLGAVIGAPSAATFESAPRGFEWVARRPWPTLADRWRRARVWAPAAPFVRAADVRPLREDDLGKLDPLLVSEVARAIGAGAIVLGRDVDDLVVCAGYVVVTTERFADVSIDTRATHRRRGHAHAVASTLCAEIEASGKTPVWGSFDDDHASSGLAESLGFVAVAPLWVSAR